MPLLSLLQTGMGSLDGCVEKDGTFYKTKDGT
jgi:hypothetical protein